MIKMFRRSLFLLILLILVGTITILLLTGSREVSGEQIRPWWKILSIPLLFALIIVSFNIAANYAEKLSNQIDSLLFENCNPQEFIYAYEKLLKRKTGNARTYILLNLSTGYFAIGKNDLAKKMLDSIYGFPNTRIGAYHKTCYYMDLTTYYLRAHDIENATNALNQIKFILENCNLKPLNFESFTTLCIQKQFLLNMANGNYEGAEDFFEKLFSMEKAKYGKVSIKHLLGEIYLHKNKLDQAKAAFTYVAENGSTTFYAEKAKRFLNQSSGA